MAVRVEPTEFRLVFFDAAELERLGDELLERLGLAGTAVEVRVDEASPLARISGEPGDPVVVEADGGAFEDTKRPRHLGPDAVANSLGRVLLRVRDRMDGSFAAAPPAAELDLPLAAAWDAYCVGRLQRAGYPQNRQRWLYAFRNRHGFSDAADLAFTRLWEADGLTLDGLRAISDAARPAARSA